MLHLLVLDLDTIFYILPCIVIVTMLIGGTRVLVTILIDVLPFP